MDAHAGKQEETVVADDTPDVVGPGVGGPSDPPGPAPIPADGAPASSPPRADGRRHCPPDQARRDQSPPACEPVRCRERPRQDGGHDGRVRHVARRRKLDPDELREHRQRRCRRRQARATECVAPAGALAQLTGQAVPHVLAGAQGAGESVKRMRMEMAESDLHACGICEPHHLQKCGSLKAPNLLRHVDHCDGSIQQVAATVVISKELISIV